MLELSHILIWFVIKYINKPAILEITYVRAVTHTLIWFKMIKIVTSVRNYVIKHSESIAAF